MPRIGQNWRKEMQLGWQRTDNPKNPDEVNHVFRCGSVIKVYTTCRGVGDFSNLHYMCEASTGDIIYESKNKQEVHTFMKAYVLTEFIKAGAVGHKYAVIGNGQIQIKDEP